jgi:hypothetical protein
MDELALLQLILSLVQGIAGDDASQAREHVPYVIEHDAAFTLAYLQNGTFGLEGAYWDRQDILTAIANVRLDTAQPHVGTITDVLDAIAALTPVTLPEVPPPGYGVSVDLSEVWLSNLEVYDWCPVD